MFDRKGFPTQHNSPVSRGMARTWSSGSRPGYETGRFTVRRLRSVFSLWRSSIRGSDLLLASIWVALSLGLGAYLFARAQAAEHLAFAQRAQRLQAAIDERLRQPYEDLATLQSLLEATGQMTRRQFHLLTAPTLGRHHLVYALEWLPLVLQPERETYEREAREAGLTDYRFWETGPDGKRRDAPIRPYYVPVHYMEPPRALALGFDIGSEPNRWRNAEKARDLGQITASPPFDLVEDAGRADAAPAIALYAPVYREGDPGSDAARRTALRGFAMAVFRAAPLAAAAAADYTDLAFSLRDVESPSGPPLAERPAGAESLPRRTGYQTRFEMRCADRDWALVTFAAPSAFRTSPRGAIGAASIGVLAALLGFVTITSLRAVSRIRRQAEKVGPYRLVARLGHGAMGVVWEARHALLRRPTAVKLLAPGAGGERALARFEREVQLTAGLTHPSTIAIYDYGRTADGVFYYAMELLRGINLMQLIAFEGPLPPARVVNLMRQACGALAEAHAAGLIHRDIKPANLMLCVYGGIPDFLKVLDFGLVKDVGAVERPAAETAGGDGDVSLSQDGSLLGTPLYMAPEGMSDPSGLDARADIFALGAVGYFLLTGSSPFPGHTAIEVFSMERHGPPPPLSRTGQPAASAQLEDVVRRCLSFEREKRPASADALDELLEACVESPPWRREDARAWWRSRGPAAMAVAREEREEKGEILFLATGDRPRS